MFVAFQLRNHCLCPIDVYDIKSDALSSSIWIDLVNPTDYEYGYILYTKLGSSLIKFLKSSSFRKTLYFLNEEHILHIRTFFLYEDSNHDIGTVVISFVICDGRLYTFCDRNVSVFLCYSISLEEEYPLIYGHVYTLLLNLFEIALDYLFNKIKFFCKNVEDLSLIVSDGLPNYKYHGILSTLSWLENIGWKIHLSLLDIQRVINFLMNKVTLSFSDYRNAKDIFTYIDFLLFHNESLFKKIHFLIQLTMNFISIEQNRIIKILSVIFLPPTLIASSYGMNFDFMPELRWDFGYPIAIILMILSGLIPYFYFKYKRWL